MTAQTIQIGNRPCRIYGEPHAEYLLLQMTGEHELQSMESEVAAIAQSAHHFLFAAVPVESWNDALSPWEAPAVWGKQGFGGNAAETLRFLTEQVIPTLKQQFPLPENVKIILGGYSLAGLFALWASTQTDLFYGVAAASPSVWFPGWMEFEQQHPIQAQRVYEVFELPQKERIEKRPAPVPNSPSSENPMSGFPTLENPTQQNTNKQNTKRQSTNLSGQTDESADFDQMEAQVRDEFRERLEIDTLAQRYDPDKLEELLDNIVEMYCCPRQTQYVGKQPQTTKAIRLRLDKLTSQHVEYIFDVMSNTTQPIKNIMAYLRTTILNAPTTMEHYYQAQGNWLTAQNRKK